MTPVIVHLMSLLLSNGSALAPANSSTVADLQAKAVAAADVGKYEQAVKYYRQERDLLIATARQADAGAIDIEIAELAHIAGRFPDAEARFEQGIALLRRYGRPDDLRLINGLDGLGWLYVTWGRNADGARRLDEARARAERVRMESTSLLIHLDTQAAYLSVAGRYSEAQKEWKRALAIGTSTYGTDEAKYGFILLHFGQASTLYGDYTTAEQMFLRYLKSQAQAPIAPTASGAAAAAELGHIYVQMRRVADARPWFDQAVEICKLVPEDAPLIRSMVLSYLGDYYMATAAWNQAEVQYREALRIRQRVLGEHPATAASMISLARALKKLHLKNEAKDMESQAKTILTASANQAPNQTVDVLALRER